MPTYKDPQNRVHYLEDAAFAHLLPQGCVEITEAEAAALISPPLTAEQITAALTVAVQAHLDATAAAHGYDNIYTACTYADEPAVALFQAEGQALRAWRSLVWAHCHAVMAAVQGGQRGVPTAAELIAELPALVMP